MSRLLFLQTKLKTVYTLLQIIFPATHWLKFFSYLYEIWHTGASLWSLETCKILFKISKREFCTPLVVHGVVVARRSGAQASRVRFHTARDSKYALLQLSLS